MKKLYSLAILLFLTIITLSQSPLKFNYQAVARNTSGALIINQAISVRISILTGSTTGSTEYSETHSVTSDAYGVFNILVGGGTVVSGSFEAITWGSASKFLKIEADVTGGTTYQTLATTQILSVPYALYATKAGNGYWTDGTDHIYANNVTTTSSVTVSDKGFLGIGTKDPQGEIHINKPIGFSGTSFTGSGINDLVVDYSNFSGTNDIIYTIEVNNTGPNPDLIRWSNNGGSTWTSDVPMQTSGLNLDNGTLIGFNVLDGHTFGDKWQFTVSQGFMNGFIVKDGKVGISTITPTEKLEVLGTVKATAFLGNGAGLTGIASGTGGVINTGTTTIGADSDADGVGNIAMQTRGTTKMIVDNNGNTGIGTTTPSAKLDVSGSINSSASDDITDILFNMKGRNTGLTGSAYNDTQNSGIIFQLKRARGKMSAPLIVTANDLLAGIEAHGYDGSSFNLSSAINFSVEPGPKTGSIPGKIIFSTRATDNTTGIAERMRITGSGYIGIGTTIPTELLEVNGNIKAISFSGNGAGLTGIATGTGGVINSGSTTIGADSDKDDIGEIVLQTKTNTRITVTNEGNIGIGTSVPQGILHVTQDKNVFLDSTLIFKNGKLGIGTNTPTKKVEVIGRVKATSFQGDTAIVAGVNMTGALVPIGAIVPWAKNMIGIPALSTNFVECNGQLLNDSESPFNGQTIPNLNIVQKFLRGSSTSGTVGGTDTHRHGTNLGTYSSYIFYRDGNDVPRTDMTRINATSNAGTGSFTGESEILTSIESSLPSYYEVVYIMRVK